jgi:hypothetical protein
VVAEPFFRILAKALWLVLGGCLLLALIYFALILMGSMLDLAEELAAKAEWDLVLLVYGVFFILVLLGVLFGMLCELVVILRRERRRKHEAEYLSSITGTASRGEKAH